MDYAMPIPLFCPPENKKLERFFCSDMMSAMADS
jgi:hypothetical protein